MNLTCFILTRTVGGPGVDLVRSDSLFARCQHCGARCWMTPETATHLDTHADARVVCRDCVKASPPDALARGLDAPAYSRHFES